MEIFRYNTIIKSKTNDNEHAKQIVRILKDNDMYVLSITKYVLTEHDYYKHLGFVELKKYKNYILIKQVYSIKINTLYLIISDIFPILKEFKTK